jgi:hypothetical protein
VLSGCSTGLVQMPYFYSLRERGQENYMVLQRILSFHALCCGCNCFYFLASFTVCFCTLQ